MGSKLLQVISLFIVLGFFLNSVVFIVKSEEKTNDDFYFVQITDTHVLHKIFDRTEIRKNRFKAVINHILDFEDKPNFIVITGDLVEWGGSGLSGMLNYMAFLDCLYEKDNQLYADENYEIPVYTTPGNHDYLFANNLFNYHKYVDKSHFKENDRYVLEYGATSFFFLDSGYLVYSQPKNWFHVYGSGLTYWGDIQWLDTKLSECTSKNKVVLMHHPAINFGDYDIIFRNREIFIDLVESYDVDLVLAGHTHASRVFDSDKNFIPNLDLPVNCKDYPTLFVQTDSTRDGCYYRNITSRGDDVWLMPCEAAPNN